MVWSAPSGLIRHSWCASALLLLVLIAAPAAAQPPPAQPAITSPQSPPVFPDVARPDRPSAAILYEDVPGAIPDIRRATGTVTWRTELAGNATRLALRADVELPDRKLTLTLLIRKNLDPALKASHTVQFNVVLPQDFAGGGIASVPGLLMKPAETAKGEPLRGSAIKLAETVFLLQLSDTEADKARNIDLLATRPWLDIPVLLNDGHRVILAIEKGPSGARAFAEALAAWGSPPPAAPPSPSVFPAPQSQAQGLPPSGPVAPAPVLPGSIGRPRVILYDEDPAVAQGLQFAGVVTWRTEPVDNAGRLAVRADIEVPTRGLKMTMRLRRNLDAALPASHVMDVSFTLRPDINGGGVDSLPGVLMKTAENVRGTPLAGLAVKVTGNVFLVGLSNVATERARNFELLTTRPWFDVPLVYANKRRAILAFAKDAAGERALTEAFAAWGEAPPPPAPPPPLAAPAPQPAAPAQPLPLFESRDVQGYLVLVSSQRSRDDAEAAWRALQEKYPSALGARPAIIVRADLGDKGVYFRVALGPFVTADEASLACGSLKGAGGQCVVQGRAR